MLIFQLTLALMLAVSAKAVPQYVNYAPAGAYAPAYAAAAPAAPAAAAPTALPVAPSLDPEYLVKAGLDASERLVQLNRILK